MEWGGVRRPGSYASLEDFGRVRLSRHFAMRSFLHSEIGSFHGIPNIPDNPDLAIATGRLLATELLDPLVETFGPIDIRSGFRSAALNHFGATVAKPQRCSANSRSFANHIWDHSDAAGRIGACACVVIPWFAAQYNRGRDWRDLAWWLYDHFPQMQLAQFFPKNAAFNFTWREAPERRIESYIAPRGTLMKPGFATEAGRKNRYEDFPGFRAISYPTIPGGADTA